MWPAGHGLDTPALKVLNLREIQRNHYVTADIALGKFSVTLILVGVISCTVIWAKQKILFKIDFFYRSVTSPFAVKIFLLPFTSHCSTKYIGFNDSGCVIKPPQPSSAIYGAPPFTGNRGKAQTARTRLPAPIETDKHRQLLKRG